MWAVMCKDEHIVSFNNLKEAKEELKHQDFIYDSCNNKKPPNDCHHRIVKLIEGEE
jgi:hypothetical protein